MSEIAHVTPLRRIIDASGHSGRYWALKAGLNTSTVTEAAAGRARLGRKAKRRLASVFGVPEIALDDTAGTAYAFEFIAGVIGVRPNDLSEPGSPAFFDMEAKELENITVAIAALVKSGNRSMAAELAERLAARLSTRAEEPPIISREGKLVEWTGLDSADSLAMAQRVFLDRARDAGGDLTLGVLQPLIDDGCFARTTIYDADEQLHIRHHATGIDHINERHRQWMLGQPADRLCVPPAVIQNLLQDLVKVRDTGVPSIRRVTAELGSKTYTWNAAVARIGGRLVGACRIVD